MLQVETTLLQADHKRVSCKPLQKAIVENDLEAFVYTLDLYEFAGAEIWPDSGAYEHAVTLDRPEMLAGPRPLAAFTHYAETHNDDIA
jgi:hypothetical protein